MTQFNMKCAIDSFLRVLNSEPDNHEIRKELANAYYRLKLYEKATGCLEEYLKLCPASFDYPKVRAQLNMLKNATTEIRIPK